MNKATSVMLSEETMKQLEWLSHNYAMAQTRSSTICWAVDMLYKEVKKTHIDIELSPEAQAKHNKKHKKSR